MKPDRPPLPRPDRNRTDNPEPDAESHLRFIRDVMTRSASFTAIPGWGAAIVGFTAIATGVIASFQTTPNVWLLCWLIECALAVAIGSVLMWRKAVSGKIPLQSGPARKYALSVLPSLVAGGLLTIILVQHELYQVLPGLWLLLYGTGTMTAGVFSVKVIPVTGGIFMLLGIVALFVPLSLGNLFLIAGFGVVHVVAGFIIAKRYGG